MLRIKKSLRYPGGRKDVIVTRPRKDKGLGKTRKIDFRLSGTQYGIIEG